MNISACLFRQMLSDKVISHIPFSTLPITYLLC